MAITVQRRMKRCQSLIFRLKGNPIIYFNDCHISTLYRLLIPNSNDPILCRMDSYCYFKSFKQQNKQIFDSFPGHLTDITTKLT